MKIYANVADNEEQGAVASARTSRSPSTFDAILADVKQKGHQQFIKTNVLGYGHDSVAEGAVTPHMAIEDVSDFAANIVATADPQLKVQMTSTRYQDMGTRPFMGLSPEANEFALGEQRRYVEALRLIEAVLARTDLPRQRTLACDMARGLLPIGISTQLSIRSDARAMRDSVSYLLGYPDPEVCAIGAELREAVKPHIETLFDRHIEPYEHPTILPASYPATTPASWNTFTIGHGLWFEATDLDALRRWRKSEYRHRVRLNHHPHGPWLTARLSSDWGAYRDLRRQRTLPQSDVFPTGVFPADPLWAFRHFYPEVCNQIPAEALMPAPRPASITLPSDLHRLSTMSALVGWKAGGHFLNWAYMMRLRSGKMCHPAYSIVARKLMSSLKINFPEAADAMGIVDDPRALGGVEFHDRVGG